MTKRYYLTVILVIISVFWMLSGDFQHGFLLLTIVYLMNDGAPDDS